MADEADADLAQDDFFRGQLAALPAWQQELARRAMAGERLVVNLPRRVARVDRLWWATVNDPNLFTSWEDEGEPPREWPWVEIPEDEWPDPEDVALVEDYSPSRRL